MSEKNLPPLPRTPHFVTVFGPGGPTRTEVFTGYQMREWGSLCARMAREEEREAWRVEVESCLRAAGVTDGMAREIAAAIRNG